VRRALAGLLAGALLAGCAGQPRNDSERGDEIETFLARSLLPLARSRPHLLSLRLDTMAQSPFRFLRGTEGLYTHDLRDEALVFARTSLPLPVTPVLLQGDAHPENLGTFGDQGSQIVGWNDYDASGYGAFWWEVRRAGAALLVALRETGAPASVEPEVVRSLAQAYVDSIFSATPTAPVKPQDVGVIIVKKLVSAGMNGAARTELNELTRLSGGARQLRRGGIDPADPHAALLDAPAAVRDALPGVLGAYRNNLPVGAPPPAFFSVKDVAFRCGQGVGSLSAVRFYVLVEGATADHADDVILQLKEESDAGLDALLPYGEPAGDQGSRVATNARLLNPGGDPFMGSTSLLGLSIMVSRVTNGQKSTRVASDLKDAAGSTPDLVRYAADEGTVLARTHARGLTPDGQSSLGVLRQALAGHEATFVAETVDAARLYADQVVGDYQLFLGLRGRLIASLALSTDAPSTNLAAALLDPPCP
jgi:uncharacterized protein (DUF2252 family)